MIRCAASHGPRSTPVRTSARGAGTRQAPCRQASHISSQEASKATDSPASTRSPGPIGSSARNRRASASTNAAAAPWLTATPFGRAGRPGGEDDPRVVVGAPGAPGVPIGALCGVRAAAVAEHRAHPGLAEHQLGAFVGVVGVDRDVGGAGGEHGQDRDVQLGGAGGDPDADPVADADARLGEAPARGLDLLGQPAVGQHGARLRRSRRRWGARSRCAARTSSSVRRAERARPEYSAGARVSASVTGYRPVGLRARRGQRAARGRMIHLPGGRAVSSAGSRSGWSTGGTTRGHSDLDYQG